MFSTDFLLASMFWGTIATGCLIYGKKQASAPPLIAGFGLIIISFFVHSTLLMSGLSVLLLGGMVWAVRMGY